MNPKKSSSLFLILVLVSSVIVLGNSRTVSALTPVADLTGEWSGFAQITNTEGTCEFTGKVNAQLTQNGNDIKGKYSFVQTGAKSSNPDVYYCDIGSFGQDIHGTLDGSRITLYSEDSTFSGWYASSGIKLDITSDGITGKTQLSPTNFTPPSLTPKSGDDDIKKKAAEEEKKKAEEAKKLKAAEEAKKKAAEEEKKKKAAQDAKKKVVDESKKKTTEEEKKSVEDTKKKTAVEEEKKATEETKKKSDTWIDVKARTIKGLSYLPVYHLFIVYHDTDGSNYVFSGGPTNDVAIGDYGSILVTSGLGKSRIDSQNVASSSLTVLSGDDAKGKNVCFQKELVRINNSFIPYKRLGPNSNSVAYTLLVDCGVPAEKPVKIAPGWGTLLK